MKKSHKLLWFSLVLVVFLVLFQKHVRISYHRLMRGYCENKAMSLPPLDDNKTKCLIDSSLHLKALVRLGYYEMKTFELKNLKKASVDARRLSYILTNLSINKDCLIAYPLRDPEVDFFNVVIYAPEDTMREYERILYAFDHTDFLGPANPLPPADIVFSTEDTEFK